MKNKLRLKYKALRSELSSEEIEEKSLEIANNLLKLPIWEFEYYHLFLSITQKKEVDTQFILHILQGKDKNVVLGKADFTSGEMQHFLLTDTTVIKVNEWNIPEPTSGIPIPQNMLEVVFIPLLAYDLQGNRIGYGKGFYDRFLSKCNPNVVKIGLSFFSPEDQFEELLNTDVAIDFAITPTKIYEFKK